MPPLPIAEADPLLKSFIKLWISKANTLFIHDIRRASIVLAEGIVKQALEGKTNAICMLSATYKADGFWTIPELKQSEKCFPELASGFGILVFRAKKKEEDLQALKTLIAVGTCGVLFQCFYSAHQSFKPEPAVARQAVLDFATLITLPEALKGFKFVKCDWEMRAPVRGKGLPLRTATAAAAAVEEDGENSDNDDDSSSSSSSSSSSCPSPSPSRAPPNKRQRQFLGETSEGTAAVEPEAEASGLGTESTSGRARLFSLLDRELDLLLEEYQEENTELKLQVAELKMDRVAWTQYAVKAIAEKDRLQAELDELKQKMVKLKEFGNEFDNLFSN